MTAVSETTARATPVRTLPALLTPAEVAGLGDRVRLVDVRTPGEFESQHLAGSYNVPLDTLAEHLSELRGLDGSRAMVLVCQSGGRARKAADALCAAGLVNVSVMDGGVNGWLAAGREVVRLKPRMSLERQVRIAAGFLAALGGFLALFVDTRFAALPVVVGSGLVFAGITDTCAMGMLIAKAPWNRAATRDVADVVRQMAAEG
jgi:rhodanese-related sulfurtransferase